MIEKNSSGVVLSDRRTVWAGGNQPAEERDASNVVTVRYFANGEQIPAASAPANKLFYTKDHLSSIREVTDSTGALRVSFTYDLFGNRTKLSGDLNTVVGYTGHHHHAASNLILTMYRAYDAELGRWLLRDPIEEEGGINLYGYVSNNPVNGVDPLGLELQEMVNTVWNVEPYDASVAKSQAIRAEAIASNSKLPGKYDGPQDAYRHCVLSCLITKYLGEDQAKQVTDEHEEKNRRNGEQNPASERMDQANSQTGRCAGKEKDDCKNKCLNLLMNGGLKWNKN